MTPRIAIAGVGQTAYSAKSGRTDRALAVEAAANALADAGIEAGEVDCVIPYHLGPTCEDLQGNLAVGDLRFTATPHLGGAGVVAGLGLAHAAIASGRASVAVAFVARNGRSETRIDRRVAVATPGAQYRTALEHPYGLNTPAQWYALICQRYMHDFRLTREQLAVVALTMREHAQCNPDAQMFGRPLSLEDYLDAPLVADPYHLYDCCLETDGAAAVVLTSVERAMDGPHRPAVLAGVAEGRPVPADDLASRRDFYATGVRAAGARALAMAGVDRADVDAACIYDCFTFEVVQQLEELGFCARGEGGEFVAEGHLSRHGSLPTNPHGGLLSEAHLAGMNHVIEAVRQVRGEAGERQLPRSSTVLVTGWGELGNGAVAVVREA